MHESVTTTTAYLRVSREIEYFAFTCEHIIFRYVSIVYPFFTWKPSKVSCKIVARKFTVVSYQST